MSQSENPSASELLAAAAFEACNPSKDPEFGVVLDAIRRTRAGQGAELAALDPLMLVDVIRCLAILGEHDTVDRAYAEWSSMPGVVHFEAGLSSLMARDKPTAESRFLRAVTDAVPQPMAWNSLALVRLARGNLDGAVAAIDAGKKALPNDALIDRHATLIKLLTLEPESRRGTKTLELTILVERFRGHAQLARSAAAELAPAASSPEVAKAIALLLKHAAALDPPMATAAPIPAPRSSVVEKGNLDVQFAPHKAPAEDPVLNAQATLGAGIFLALMGLLRAALATRANNTNSLMVVAGIGLAVYGAIAWLRKS